MFVCVVSCPGGFEVPFGQSEHCFFVSAWGSEKALFRCFLLLRGGGSVWPDSALSFSLVRGARQCVGFSVEEGGQTEWRWVGRVGLLGRCIRERNLCCVCPNHKLTVNCKKTLCKKYFIISIGCIEKNVFLRR